MRENIIRALGIFAVVSVTLIMLMILTACGSSAKVSNQDEQIRNLQRLLQQQIVVANQQAELLEQLLAADVETQDIIVAIYADLAIVQANVNSMLIEMATLQGYQHIESFIDPCGDHTSKIDEVLLGMADGKILVSFSDKANGQNTRFAVLPAGNYVTTDGTNCNFSVLTNGNVTW